ncbi:MAG: hypothetical protein MUC63_09675, partial [Planctomycetes bacterium]|nr:hypothetical protein [Planctomycetota bacterium]
MDRRPTIVCRGPAGARGARGTRRAFARIAAAASAVLALWAFPERAPGQAPMPPGRSAFVPCDPAAQAEVRLVAEFLARGRWAEALRRAREVQRNSGEGASEPVVQDPWTPAVCRGLLECLLALARRLPPGEARALREEGDAAAEAPFALACTSGAPEELIAFARRHPFSGLRLRALRLAADRLLEEGRALEAEGCLEAVLREGPPGAGGGLAARLAFAGARLDPDPARPRAPFRGFRLAASVRRSDTPPGGFATDSVRAPPAEEPAVPARALALSLPGTVEAFFPARGSLFRWAPLLRIEPGDATRRARKLAGRSPALASTFPVARILAEGDAGWSIGWTAESEGPSSWPLPSLACWGVEGTPAVPSVRWARFPTEIAAGRDFALFTQPAGRGGRVWIGLR